MGNRRENFSTAQEFIAEQWPKILAATVVGTTIVLLIRYYRNRKSETLTLQENNDLSAMESEAVFGGDSTVLLLDTALPLVTGDPVARELASELADQLPDQMQAAMRTISELKK